MTYLESYKDIALITPYEKARWQMLCDRDKDETLQRINSSPPPMFMDRVEDDFAETDAIAEFAIKHDWSTK